MIDQAWEKHGVTNRLVGHVAIEQVNQSATCMYADERFGDMRWMISDVSACQPFALNEKDWTLFVAMANAALLSTKAKFCAIFVGPFPELRLLVEGQITTSLFRHPVCWFDTLGEARSFVDVWMEIKTLCQPSCENYLSAKCYQCFPPGTRDSRLQRRVSVPKPQHQKLS